jgi:hypothetical protein
MQLEKIPSGITFTKWTFPESLFSIVDVTYILYLRGSPRIADVERQIKNSPPTKIVYLITNDGYKKSHRPFLPEQSTLADCCYSHYTACEHAHRHGYNNILILEDDFIFEKDIIDLNNTKSIEKFILGNDIQRYFLGCIPFMLVPSSLNLTHYKMINGGASHAVIHTKRGIETFLQDYRRDPKSLLQIDMYFAQNEAYTFHKSLCTQMFPMTQNRSENWGDTETIKGKFFNWGINLLNLDKKTQPGTDTMYGLAKSVPYLIILIIVVIILS